MFSSKIKSRRFIVFMIWTVLVGLSIFITNTIIPEIISWYGVISMLYIGSSVAKSYIFKDNNSDSSKSKGGELS